MPQNKLITQRALLTTTCVLLISATTACTNKSYYPYSLPTGYHYNKEKASQKTDQNSDNTNVAAQDSALSRSTPEEEYEYVFSIDDDGTEYRHWNYDRERGGDTLKEPQARVETVIDRNAGPRAWQQAADDLISRMVQNLGMPAETIYLRPENARSPYNSGFASALYNSLENKGLAVTMEEGGGPFALTYTVEDDGYSGQLPLKIWLSASYKIANEESGVYKISPAGSKTPMDDAKAPAPAPATDSSGPMPLSPYAP